MTSKRERYERANMRGGLGVRKRLSEESMRDTYRLNGVRTGMAVARCLDRYGRWELGYTLGVVVRKTASVVQVRWADSQEEITTYEQGDARYEVDRGRWRILGLVQAGPLDPDNPLAVALTELRQSGIMPHAADDAATPPTEEHNMTDMSNAAAERAAARKALKNGDLKERETYTAKQVAARCGTDSKTMRKFFRSSASTVEPVGQGGRYEFDAADLPKIKQEFITWRKKAKARQVQAKSKPEHDQVVSYPGEMLTREEVKEIDEDDLRKEDHELLGEDPGDPTPEELAELENLELDLDELDEEDN